MPQVITRPKSKPWVDYWDMLKANGVPIKLVRSRIVVRAVDMLFKALVIELNTDRKSVV